MGTRNGQHIQEGDQQPPRKRRKPLFDDVLDDTEDDADIAANGGPSRESRKSRESLFARSRVRESSPPRQSLFSQTNTEQTSTGKYPATASSRIAGTAGRPASRSNQQRFDLPDDESEPLPYQFSRTRRPNADEWDDEAERPSPYAKSGGRTRPPQSHKQAQAYRPSPPPIFSAFFPKPKSLAQEYCETKADLKRARMLQAQEYPLFPFPIIFTRPRMAWYQHPVVITTILLSSLAIILALLFGGNTLPWSRWLVPLSLTFQRVIPGPSPNPPGDYRLRGAASLSAEKIDEILSSYGSPAAGTGENWIRLGRKYDIDPAFALAFFIHESTAGTHPAWAGNKTDGTTTHNIGNIICAGYSRCYGRFRDYGSWEEGIEDWYRLIDVEYIRGRGTETLDEIIPIYAPSTENDVGGYVAVIKNLVDSWRYSGMQGRGLGGMRPNGSPLRERGIVMTQGYGVGSHAPAHIWGAIDLAVDSNGDGMADPEGTSGQPIYATHSGIARVQSNTWPAGNHIWIINDDYKTGYAHLKEFAITEGQVVQDGDLIGFIGSTGQSSGPHLDYQIWQKIAGSWVNQNPLNYAAFP